MKNTTKVENQVNQIKSHQRNCALRSGGGWWFSNLITCLPVNLNGIYVNGRQINYIFNELKNMSN